MKILFVCFSYSVHAARWISMARRPGWDVHVFPSQEFDALHEDFRDVTYWPAKPREFEPHPSIRVESRSLVLRRRAAGRLGFAEYLSRVLEEGLYDVVHTLEIQHAGYLTLEAQRVRTPFPRPRWIVTNYGSDIFFFGRDPQHRERIRLVLENCDYYSAECHRDLRLAIEYGFKGRLFEIVPNGGGIDVIRDMPVRQPAPPSQRRVIAVKGYEHFVGRALIVLRALETLAPVLAGYRIVVHSPSPAVREAAEAMAGRTGLAIACLPERVSHAEIMALHASSRISIANSLSDGICTALIEAMAMGAFPIQSRTACADEWIVPGETGFTPDPEDEAEIGRSIRQALEDDGLVDRAAMVNGETIRRRADRQAVQARVGLAYSKVLAEMATVRGEADEVPLPPNGPLPQPQRPYAPGRTAAASGRPVLTVVTPSYNRADFLPETIESVLSQDFEDFEYLIFDDGSRDNTAEVVARYSDPRLKYFRHDNVGETLTVNRALRHVTGEFFTIINSDDPAVADSFSKLIEVLRGDESLLMAYPNWYLIDETSEVKTAIRMPQFDAERLLTSGSLSLGPGAMFRSRVIESVGLRDPLLRYSADLDFIFRVALSGPIRHVPQYLGTHRVHPGSASISDQGLRLAREAAYPAQAYSLHPRLSGLAARRHREGVASGHFAAAFVGHDRRQVMGRLIRAFLGQPVFTLALMAGFDFDRISERLRELGAQEPKEATGPRLDAVLTAPSRYAALRPLVRAFLDDPIGMLDTAGEIGHVELDRRIRAMPMHASPRG